MAELHTYKCQKCGFETSASPGGGDLLMDGGSYSHFMCPHCKSIVDLVFDPFKPKSEISDHPVVQGVVMRIFFHGIPLMAIVLNVVVRWKI